MYDIYDNDFDKAFDEAVDEVQKAYDRGFAEGYAKGKAEAEPIKHGRWETTRPDAPMFGFYYCSICGRKRTSPQDNYCPHCGAKMDLPEPQNVKIINDGTYETAESLDYLTREKR